MEPGIYDIDNETYHSGAGISKSGLWTLFKKTPEHFIGAERKETAAKAFGTACHTALLEPELLERSYCIIPADAPRRPSSAQINAKNPSAETIAAIRWWNEWNASTAGRTEISVDDWNSVLKVRDKLHADPLVKRIIDGAVFEKSAYWIDEETGELCRCRPDIYSPKLGMMGDLKTCRDASEWGFGKAAYDYGYYMQDPFYSEGWEKAGGGEVETFVFISVESEAPHAFQIYTLDAEDFERGRRDAQAALRTYAECKRTGVWPGYGGGVKSIKLPSYARRNDTDIAA